jgi:hypothetical protein
MDDVPTLETIARRDAGHYRITEEERDWHRYLREPREDRDVSDKPSDFLIILAVVEFLRQTWV